MSKKREKKKGKKIKNLTLRELKEALAKLPVITVGTKAKNNQVIKGREQGAYYEITKERSSGYPDFVVYMLYVSGPQENRLSLTSLFIEKLGNPYTRFQNKNLPDAEYLYWIAEEVEEEKVVS